MQETDLLLNHFLALLTSQSIIATIRTTIIIPTHNPALNIPPITSQLLTVVSKSKHGSRKLFVCFIMLYLYCF